MLGQIRGQTDGLIEGNSLVGGLQGYPAVFTVLGELGTPDPLSTPGIDSHPV
ncbi:hypothetical protein FRUB_05117 [Fimbriiglobus ruber]|uniref:Uncharacterized protein n=1 Tax=Fimbriiglobus ruber TaxID=1908690 RepID=A0A225DEE8_9BACT|nr:hypothetical protein FRUB_05722 [Fimbriiglobus ruber]OWK40198.1 hypothetical protein FRUB_05117 [Fimbriiglobus ruber]